MRSPEEGWETRLMQSEEGGGPDSGGRNTGSLTNTGQPYRLPHPARHSEATRACVWDGRMSDHPSERIAGCDARSPLFR
ncbi:protein of unknown function [Cupriavidus taiwanensis]|nr:protein of unknown function [Cupriavidus taiwanensis]